MHRYLVEQQHWLSESQFIACMALAQAARLQAAKRDQQRTLPWAQLEQFTRSGLGSISIPRAYGGPEVSFVTLAEVFAIISAADPALGQIPQNHFGILYLLQGTATERQKKQLFQNVLDGWRIGNGGPERGTKNTLELKARLNVLQQLLPLLLRQRLRQRPR